MSVSSLIFLNRQPSKNRKSKGRRTYFVHLQGHDLFGAMVFDFDHSTRDLSWRAAEGKRHTLMGSQKKGEDCQSCCGLPPLGFYTWVFGQVSKSLDP